MNTPLRHQSGQVTAEFVMIAVSLVITTALIGYGTSRSLCTSTMTAADCGNVFVELGKTMSDSLATLTTILNLPF